MLSFSFLCYCFLSHLAPYAEGESHFEAPPILEASELLRPQLLRSEIHTVRDIVKNDGYMNLYTVDSPFGALSARGTLQLETLVQELHAINDIQQRYPSTTVVADAAYETGKGIVTAPINAVERAAKTLGDRKKLAETIESVPGGVANLFSAAAGAIGASAQFLADSGRGALGSSEGKRNAKDSWDQATAIASKAALDYVGYNRAARDVLREYSLDPYTTNELVRAEVRRIASIKSGVGLAGKFAPGVPSIPYIGSFNRYVGQAEDIASYEEPEKIAELNERMMRTLGSRNSPQAPAWQASFRDNKNFSPLMKQLLLKNVDALGEIPGIAEFMVAATTAKSREGGVFYVLASKELREQHEKRAKLTKIVTAAGKLPAGLTHSRTLYVPVPVDFLSWTEPTAKVFVELAELRRRDPTVQRFEVEVMGGISDRCRAELRKLGVTQIRTKGGV